MNLIEADGKALMRRHGLRVPRGILLPPEVLLESAPGERVAVKAQLFAGGRGRVGLVRLCSAADAANAVHDVRAAMAQRDAPGYVLVEEAVDIEHEYYLAVRIDDSSQRMALVFSVGGGVAVEEGAKPLTFDLPFGADVRPDQLLAFFRDAGVSGKALGGLCRFAATLCRVFVAEDAELIEVNPLARLSDGSFVALDAKVVLDGDAHFRHLEREDTVSWALRRSGLTRLEIEAAELGITFLPLDGDIALLTGGAGNGMLVFDALADAGYRPANFVDTIGGSGAERWRRLGEIVFAHARQPHVRAIVAYFTLSVTPLRNLVDGLLGLLAQGAPPKPLVIGVMASGASESLLNLRDAQVLLREAGLDCLVELPDVVARLQRTVPAG